MSRLQKAKHRATTSMPHASNSLSGFGHQLLGSAKPSLLPSSLSPKSIGVITSVDRKQHSRRKTTSLTREPLIPASHEPNNSLVSGERTFDDFARRIILGESSESAAIPQIVTQAASVTPSCLISAYRIFARRHDMVRICLAACAEAQESARPAAITHVKEFLELWLRSKDELSVSDLKKLLVAVQKRTGGEQQSWEGLDNRIKVELLKASERKPLNAHLPLAVLDTQHASLDDVASFELTASSAAVIANELARINCSNLCRIPIREFIDHTWSAGSSNTPILDQCARRFNEVSWWVASCIVGAADAKARLSALELFIEVAYELRRIRDFQGMMSVVSGLNHVSVIRLKALFDKLPPYFSSRLQRLEELMDLGTNYQRYRRVVAQTRKPTLPFVALLLSDFEFIRAGNPLFRQGILNHDLFILVHERLATFRPESFQVHYPACMDGLDTVTSALGRLCFMDDDALISASHAIEPPRWGRALTAASRDIGSSVTKENDLSELEDQPWFANCTRAEAESALLQLECNSFLIRPSSQPKTFALSQYFVEHHAARHLVITQVDTGFVIADLDQTVYSSLAVLAETSSHLVGWTSLGNKEMTDVESEFFFEVDRNRAVLILERTERDSFLMRPSPQADRIVLTKYNAQPGACQHFLVSCGEQFAILGSELDSAGYLSLDDLVKNSPEIRGFASPAAADVAAVLSQSISLLPRGRGTFCRRLRSDSNTSSCSSWSSEA